MSLLAIVVSFVALYRTSKFSQANLQLYINERITNTKERVGELSAQMAPLLAKTRKSQQDKEHLSILEQVFNSALENNLNAYEAACSKYIDKQVDRTRFKKSYNVEIRQLVERESLQKYFDPVKTRYRAILKVYEEWNNLEK